MAIIACRVLPPSGVYPGQHTRVGDRRIGRPHLRTYRLGAAAASSPAVCPATPAPSAAHFQARVTAVHDGDSVRATDRHGQRHKIRLAYIDAPELQQAHGMAARDALRRLIDGQQVEVAVLDTDQYGREVAQIRLHGRDINLAQIEEGHAWHYVSIAKRRQDKADFAAYSRAEAGARSSRFGLWRAQSPQAPWAYRKAQSAEQVQ